MLCIKLLIIIIIHTLMFKKIQPSQSTPPYYTSYNLNTPKKTRISIPQWHSKHPFNHHLLRPRQTMQNLSFHHPGFSPICQYTHTSLVYSSVYIIRCDFRLSELKTDHSTNLTQVATLILDLDASTRLPASSVSPMMQNLATIHSKFITSLSRS